MKRYVLERRNGNRWVEYHSIMENYTRNRIDYLKSIYANDGYEHYRIVIENKNYRKVVFVQTGKRVFTEPAINE